MFAHVRGHTKTLFINPHVAEKKGEKLIIENNGHVLISLDRGKPIEKGQECRDLRGKTHNIVGGEAPNCPHRVGKALTSEGQWFSPTALDLHWLKIVEHDNGEQPCLK